MMQLSEKIDYSIALIHKGERLALSLNPEEGYFVGFSGGKDSQVLLELVKMAGVKYHAYYSVTTNDPPENVRFIRENYPEVTFIHPKETFLKLVGKKGLPTMTHRFCCERLKEHAGVGNLVLTGVRAEESRKRAKYDEVKVYSRRKEHSDRHKVTIESMEENEHKCVKGQDKVMLYPILHWTEKDIWSFIKEYHIPQNPCYKMAGRVGCMFCPFANKKQIQMYEDRYPKYKYNIIKALTLFYEKSDKHYFDTPEQYYEWWKSKKSVKEYRYKISQTEILFE